MSAAGSSARTLSRKSRSTIVAAPGSLEQTGIEGREFVERAALQSALPLGVGNSPKARAGGMPALPSGLCSKDSESLRANGYGAL